jgi:HlyD family secretion protein
MKGKKLWLFVVIVAILGVGYYFRTNLLGLAYQVSGGAVGAQGTGAAPDLSSMTTTTIRSANEADQISAAGNIELSDERLVMSDIDGLVTNVYVKEGDVITATQLLVQMDPTDFLRAVTKAELTLAAAEADRDKLLETASEAEVASARAKLASAQQALADVKDGPTKAELAAAEATLAAAQAKYQELKDGPSEAELTQLSVEMQKALVTLQDAQAAYDRVSYQGNIGASQEAADLQDATIDYEAAKAAYEISTEPASQSDLQDALSAIQTAQNSLDTLRSQPTAADLAAAEADVASAQSTLDDLLSGTSDAELRSAEVTVKQAQMSLEDAQTDVKRTELRSPIDGSVLSVDVKVGTVAEPGTSAVTVANLKDLEFTVNVAEVDITKVNVGQKAKVTVDALPDAEFTGTVVRIAATSSSTSGVVNYPVTIGLAVEELVGVRPGMTAVATILPDDESANRWLVPTNSLVERDGNTTVMIMRDKKPNPVSVVVIESQGEWTVVESPDLREGDAAIGGVTSYVDQENEQRGFGGGMMLGGGGGPPPGGGGPR